MFLYLMSYSNKAKPLPSEAFKELFRSKNGEIPRNTFNQRISRLRKKLEKAGLPGADVIQTVRSDYGRAFVFYCIWRNICTKQDSAATVEEEIGLNGSRNVDEYFLWDVDAAFVCDRRGTNDIVVSFGDECFCDEAFGKFIEQIAKENELGE